MTTDQVQSEPTLEASMSELETLAQALEGGVGLEEGVEKFVRGHELLARCRHVLEEIEGEVERIEERPVARTSRVLDESRHPGEARESRREAREDSVGRGENAIQQKPAPVRMESP